MSAIAPEKPITPREKRTHSVELREVETTASYSMLRGVAVPYNDPADIGWFLEDFAPGSLAKSIREAASSLPLLLFHDNRTIGSIIGTAEKWDDGEDALIGTWRLAQTEEARRAAQLMADGMLSYFSISFQPVRDAWTFLDDADWDPSLGPDHKDRVTRVEARLLETSAVTTPAYKNASLEWVRTAAKPRNRDAGVAEVAAWRAEIDRLRNGSPA